MRELRTEVTIDAPAQRVWDVITDFGSFSDWNPFMQRASGEVAVGNKLTVYLKPPGGMGMSIKPRIIEVDPGREFRWLGHLLMPGIFDGEHVFEIVPIGDASCRFVQREEFSGILAPLMLAMIGKSTERGFNEMNQALKARAEDTALG
jgi:hypothetical protein